MGKLQDYYNKATGMADNNEDDHERSGAPADDIQFTKEKGIQETTQKLTEPAIPSLSTTPSPQKPNWMNDDDFKEATQYFSPDQLNKLYKDFDPQSATPLFQDLYKASIKAPEVLDEKRIKASNTIAGVADALSLLTQGIAGANGAYIPRMDQSSLKQNSDYVQRMRDIYKADRDRYNAGLFESSSRDIEAARQGHTRDRNTLLGVIQNARGLRNTRDIANNKNDVDRWKYGKEMGFKEAAANETGRHNRAMEIAAYKNAASNALRASRYGQNTSGSDGTPKGAVDYYNPKTNTYYRINEKKLKAFAPQIFKLMLDDVFKGNQSVKRQYDALSPSERLNFIQMHWPDSPAAVKYMEKIKDGKFAGEYGDDGEVENTETALASDLSQLARPSYRGPMRPDAPINNEARHPEVKENQQGEVDYSQYIEQPTIHNASQTNPQNNNNNSDQQRPTNKYEAIVYDAKMREEKKLAEAESLKQKQRVAPIEKHTELLDQISELEKQLVGDVDPENIINTNNLGVFDAAKIRYQASEDKKRNAKIRREIQRLNTQAARLNLPD